MSRVKDGNYVVIQSFMVKDLGLKGNELLVYAIIYGFSQDSQKFTGSIQYLAEWANCSKSSIVRNLKDLCEKKLITKYEIERNGVKFCEYQSNFDTGGIKNAIPSVKMTPGGGSKMTPGGSVKMTPNNISRDNLSKDNIDNILDWKASSDLSPRMKAKIDDWLEYKKERRQSYKPMGLKTLLTQIGSKVSVYGEDAVIKAIDLSMSSNYSGIVFDRLEKEKQKPNENVCSDGFESSNPFLRRLHEKQIRGEID